MTFRLIVPLLLAILTCDRAFGQTTMVVPPEEVPASCAFPNGVPGSPASVFWNLWDSTAGDCSLGGPELGFYQITRTDSAAYVIQAGQLTRANGLSEVSANCPVCCGIPDCHSNLPTLTAVGTLGITRQREWSITAGFEVSAGLKIGIPLAGEAEIRASLTGSTGMGGSLTLNHEISYSLPVLPCRKTEVALSAQVYSGRVWAVDHSYQFQARVHANNPCPSAGHVITLATCVNARRSELESEGWDDMRFTLRVVDESACD